MNNLQELNIYEFFENPRILCNEDYTYKIFHLRESNYMILLT